MKRLLVLSALVAAVACEPPKHPVPGNQGPITPELVLRHVKFLADDAQEGRGIGTKGLDVSADYIAKEFAASGLKPGGVDGTFFQPFDMTTGVRLGSNNAMTLTGPDGSTAALAIDKDFRPLHFSESGTVDAPVAFAGYGITAPELDWDDYKGLDAAGKIVIVLLHEPGEKDLKSKFNTASVSRDPHADAKDAHALAHELTRYSELRVKAINARLHGATGMILVNDTIAHPGKSDDLIKLEPDADAAFAGLLAVHAKRAAVDRLLMPAKSSLEKLENDVLSTPASKSFEKTSAKITVDLFKSKKPVKNVIGILPGVDATMAQEAVVIGAHYDHLGYGGRDSLDPDRKGQVHNGADDNASGTAALMAIGRWFGTHPDGPPRRTTIFIAFTAEEAGLGGSSWYVHHPLWPLEKTVAMLNMDMVGRMQNDKVIAFGAATATEFGSMVESANVEKLSITANGDGYGPSDQTAFYAKNIPVLHFFTGAHLDYHRTTDDWEKINADGLAKVARLVAHIAGALADRDNRVTFVPSSNIPHAQGAVGSAGGGYGSYFGSIPDFTESEVAGVAITGTRAGSPAEKAGLVQGDRIVKFGDVTIANLYDLTFALRRYKPGDEVEIVFLRGKESKTGKATLGEPARRTD